MIPQKVLDIIKQKPRKWKNIIICPYCSSNDLYIGGSTTTLVGGGEENNHIHTQIRCNKCKKEFVHERHGGYEWYTRYENYKCFSILGASGCFEPVIYTCKKCGGNIIEKIVDENGNDTNYCVSFKDGKQIGKTIWYCDSCGISVDTVEEYKINKKVKINFKMKEKIGKTIFNTKGIDKIDIN